MVGLAGDWELLRLSAFNTIQHARCQAFVCTLYRCSHPQTAENFVSVSGSNAGHLAVLQVCAWCLLYCHIRALAGMLTPCTA